MKMAEIGAVELSLNTSNFDGSIEQSIRRLTAMGAELQALQMLGTNYENSMEGLSKKHDILTRSVEASNLKLTEQRRKYEELIASESANTEAIEKQAIAVNEALVEYNRLNTQLKDVDNQLNVQSSSWNKFQEAGGKVKSVGESISSITAPIKDFGVFAFNAAVDFESAFVGVRQTVNTSEEGFKKLEDGIRGMAKELPVSATEIAGVVESAGQLGIAEEHLLSFSRTVIDMGNSTSMTREQAAKEFADFANIVGMGQGDFDRLGSSIVELSSKMNVSASDIMAMGMGFAEQASKAGLTEAQIMGLAATMSSLGINAETGGAAMTSVLQKIQKAVGDGGDSLSGFAKAANMSSADFKKAFETDAASALDLLVKGLAESAEGGANLKSILSDLGVSGNETDVLLKMADASDLLSSAVNSSSSAWEENTALSDKAAERYKTTESQIATMKNELTDIGISIGNILIPIVKSFLEKLQPWIEKFSNLSDGTKKLITIIGGIAAVIGPVLAVFGTVISTVGTIIGAFSSLGSVFAVLSGPIGWIVAGIAALIAGGIALYKNWDVVSAKAVEIWDGIASFFSGLWTSITEAASAAWDWFTQLLSDLWTGLVVGAEAIWTGLVDLLAGIWTSITEAASVAWEEFIQLLSDLWTAIIEGAIEIWGGMVEFFSELWTNITEIASIAWEEFTQLLSDLWTSIIEGAIEIWEGMITFFSELWTNITEIASIAWEAFSQLLSDLWTSIVDGAIEIWTSFVESLSEIWSSIVGVATEIWGSISSTIINIVSTIISGIEIGWNKLKQTTEIVFNVVKSFLSDVWNNVKNMIVGTVGSIVDLVISGWTRFSQMTTNTFNTIKNFLSNVWESIKTTVVNTATQLVTSTIQKFLDIKVAIETKMNEAKKVVTDIWDKILSIFKALDLRKIGNDVIQGLINGIGDMSKLVWEKAKSIATSIGDAIKSTLKINSPSRVMIAIGKGVGEGLAIGIEKGSDGVNRAAEKLAEAAIPDLTERLSISKEAIEKAQQIVSNVIKANAAEIQALQKEAENKKVEISQQASDKITAIKNNAAKKQVTLTVDQVAQIKKIEEQSLKDREAITKQYAEKMAKAESKSADIKFKALKEYVEAQKSAGEMSAKQEAEFWRYSATAFKEGTKEKTNALKEFKKAYSEMVKEQFEKEKDSIEKRKKYNSLSLAEELKFYERYLGHYEAGTDERTYYEEKFYNTKKEISEKIKTINNDYLKQTQDVNKKLLDEEQKLNDAYNNALESRIKSIKGYFGLFDEVKVADPVDSSSLTQNLSEQVNALSQWRIELSKLEIRGLSSAIIDELEAMGPSVLAQLEALNRMTDSEMFQYQDLYEKKLLIARESAIKELEPLEAETKAKIEGLRKTANSELNTLNSEWQKKIKDVVLGTEETLGSMNEIGKNAIQGLIDGMMGMQSALQQTANNLVRNVSDTLRDVLNLNPTSSLLQKVGDGLVDGFDSIMNKATNVSKHLANSVMQESSSSLPMQKSKNNKTSQNSGPSTIVVQSILDGQVLGESVVDVVSGKQYSNASIHALTRGLSGI